MLKIKLPIPPFERMIKGFCDDIVDVKFDPLPAPVSCIATINHGADVENIANTIRNNSFFGKNIEVEVISDDILYQEHIEADGDDESMALFNDFEKNNIEPKREGIDDETFIKLLQMRLRGPRPLASNDDVIEILSDSSEEDLDNEEVLSKIDDDANTFIDGLLEIQNLYTTKSLDNEETSNEPLINDNSDEKSPTDIEKKLKRPREFGGTHIESFLNTIKSPATDSNKKMKCDRLDALLIQDDVPSKENNRTVLFEQTDIKHGSQDSDLNSIPTNANHSLSFSELNGTSEEDGTT